MWEKFEDTLAYLNKVGKACTPAGVMLQACRFPGVEWLRGQVFHEQGPFDGIFGFSQGVRGRPAASVQVWGAGSEAAARSPGQAGADAVQRQACVAGMLAALQV